MKWVVSRWDYHGNFDREVSINGTNILLGVSFFLTMKKWVLSMGFLWDYHGNLVNNGYSE